MTLCQQQHTAGVIIALVVLISKDKVSLLEYHEQITVPIERIILVLLNSTDKVILNTNN